MTTAPGPHHSFVFLQGPPGPLFHRLAQELRRTGAEVHRINLCAGDAFDWRGPATRFRGRFSQWPVFFDKFLLRHAITDVLLFGDCRKYHVTALRIAAMRGIRTHVLEEGYLRPHWMTLERDGVNAHSRLPKDKHWVFERARHIADEQDQTPITASFRRRIRDALSYYTAVQLGGLAYPFYRSHRTQWPITEGVGWVWRYLTAGRSARAADRTLSDLKGKPFFLLPLQLSGDFQIRAHSPFPDMPAATDYVLESFAAHAPPETHLLIKEHPLDCSFFSWRRFIRRRARALNVSKRVHYISGGDLEDLAAETRGMVVVNSTSATLALRSGRPVCVLGDAIYRMSGMTFDGHLDQFWTSATPPEPGLYDAFRRLLVNQAMVRGGLASESAVTILVSTMAERLREEEATAYKPESQESTASKWSDQVGAR